MKNLVASATLLIASCGLAAPAVARPPNVVVILADDLGFSDLGCYGSEIRTPNLDRLAAGGLRFTQFTNAARCCPTRAALLTGLYPHQAGVGHMLQDWAPPGYTSGLNDRSATFGELLRAAGYRTYYVGKWHVGRLNGQAPMVHPLDRGFDRFHGTGGGGNYFAPSPLLRDRERIAPPVDGYYATDDFSMAAVRFLRDHAREHGAKPFLLHLCYTAPHFPLHAPPEDIATYRDAYRDGWDALRERRHRRMKELGIVDAGWPLAPRDPIATPWAEMTAKDEWSLRMAVHAAMVDRMDRGIGRLLAALDEAGVAQDTLVLFLSDNGASAEALDTWPVLARGHRPGAVLGTKDSHRCLEVGWANAANTPFRGHKMGVHEGGVATPLIAHWPAGIKAKGGLSHEVGHVIDFLPTLLELAGTPYPKQFDGRSLLPLEGRSFAPAFRGESPGGERALFWEHEGNRAVRLGRRKLVAPFQGPWELYDVQDDRTEGRDLAPRRPEEVEQLAALWQRWADRVGVVPWEKLPGSNYTPTPSYRKNSEILPP